MDEKDRQEQHTIPDSLVLELRFSLPPLWIEGREWYRWYWSWYLQTHGLLDRSLTIEEADSIRGRLNGFGPVPYEESWDSVRRSDFSFWRGTPLS